LKTKDKKARTHEALEELTDEERRKLKLTTPTDRSHMTRILRRAAPHGLDAFTKPDWSSSGCSGRRAGRCGLRNRSEGGGAYRYVSNAKGKENGDAASTARSCRIAARLYRVFDQACTRVRRWSRPPGRAGRQNHVDEHDLYVSQETRDNFSSPAWRGVAARYDGLKSCWVDRNNYEAKEEIH